MSCHGPQNSLFARSLRIQLLPVYADFTVNSRKTRSVTGNLVMAFFIQIALRTIVCCSSSCLPLRLLLPCSFSTKGTIMWTFHQRENTSIVTFYSILQSNFSKRMNEDCGVTPLLQSRAMNSSRRLDSSSHFTPLSILLLPPPTCCLVATTLRT